MGLVVMGERATQDIGGVGCAEWGYQADFFQVRRRRDAGANRGKARDVRQAR